MIVHSDYEPCLSKTQFGMIQGKEKVLIISSIWLLKGVIQKYHAGLSMYCRQL